MHSTKHTDSKRKFADRNTAPHLASASWGAFFILVTLADRHKQRHYMWRLLRLAIVRQALHP